MRTVAISHKTRYWQEYCFGNPPEGYRYVRGWDMPWHLLGLRAEFVANTKVFLPKGGTDLYHTYNGVVANAHPWVVEVEDYLPRYEQLSRSHPLFKWALRRLAGKHCKALIYTSLEAMGRNRAGLEAAGVDPEKMTVIYRAVEQYAPLERAADRFTVLFAGNGFYRKGGVELLKAFKALGQPEARLVIISRLEVDWGVFPGNDTIEWARKAIADDPRIVLLEELPHAQVIEQMRRADVFVGTTFMDPFNNTVLEAMGCRVPVICSDVGALPEVVRDGANGWMLSVKGRTSDDIAEEVAARLRQLMDDPGLRQRMGTANDAIIGERFNLQVRNAALGRLYDAALADR